MTHIRSTTSWALRLMQSRPMTDREAWALIEPHRCALQRLLDHVGAFDDLLLVATAINVAWMRAQAIGNNAEAIATFQAAGAACHAIEAAAEASRQFDVTPTQREALCEAIHLYDCVLRHSSIAQWQQAEHDLYRHHLTQA